MNLRPALLSLGLMACTPTPETYQGPQQPTSETVAPVEAPSRLTLGGATFLIGPESGFTPEERIELAEKMQSAHARLSAELGSEIMTLLEPMEVPVKMKRCQGCANGRVVWGRGQINFDDELKPHWGGENFNGAEIEFSMLEESTVAHEFLHFYAQHSIFWSEAFYEGIVHGTIRNLYPDAQLTDERKNALQIVRNRCMRALFEKGWDYSQADTALHGGIQDVHLSNLFYAHLNASWGDFIESHPDFPKRFFQQILEGRRQGKIDFSKDELMEIARQITPDFDQWVEKGGGASTRDIEPQKQLFILPLEREKLLVVKLGLQEHDVKEGDYLPGVGDRLSAGTPLLMHPGGAPLELTTTGAISILPVNGLSQLSSWHVEIGDKRMPIMHPWTCQLHDSFPPR